MAKVRAEDMYWRIYADHQRKVFCHTMIPLTDYTVRPIVNDEELLKDIAKGLEAIGWQKVQRKAFEILTKL